MNLIFGEKLILKHIMHRTIPKRCILGVFWTAQYVSKVYFTLRRLLTLLTSFYGYNAFGWIYILLTLKNNKKKLPFTNSYILGICSWMVFLSISAKNQRTFILTWILFFHFPIKLVLPTYSPFSWSSSHFQLIFQFIKIIITTIQNVN